MHPIRRGKPSLLSLTPTKKAIAHATTQDPESILQRYLNWHNAEGHSGQTESSYQKALRLLFKYLKTEYELDDLTRITVDHLRARLVWLRNTPSRYHRPRSSKSIESYCRHMLAFFRWCFAEGILEHDPTERIKLPKAEKKIIRVFTDEEIKLMHEACTAPSNGLRADVRRMLTARNRAILWTLLDTGMRVSELCKMRFMDLDRRRGSIYIMGKGAKERKLTMGQIGYHYLTAYLDQWRGEPESQDERLLLADDGSPLTPNAIDQMFGKMKRRCGIPDKRASPHTCRHWFAIRFLLDGGKLFALQKILGHETLEMVKIYAYITDQDADEERRKYSPADDIQLEERKPHRRGFRKG
jgi:site-specific recombinase XerD